MAEPTHISSSLQAFLDKVAMVTYGITCDQARAKKICINCKASIKGRIITLAGEREYKMSGLCEICFDAIPKEAQ